MLCMPTTLTECLEFADIIRQGAFPGARLHPPFTTTSKAKLASLVAAAVEVNIVKLDPNRTTSGKMALSVVEQLAQMDNDVATHLADPTRDPILLVTNGQVGTGRHGVGGGVGLRVTEGLVGICLYMPTEPKSTSANCVA